MDPLEDIKSLQSGDAQQQVSALDNLVDFLHSAVGQALASLQTSSNPLPLAERIFNFGSMARPQLERMFLETSDSGLKAIVAALLVQLGSKTGVETLLDAIKNGTEYQHLATISLAKADICEAAPVIIEKLESLSRDFYTKRENAPFIYTFLSALEALNCNLPIHLKERFTSPDVPRDLSSFIK